MKRLPALLASVALLGASLLPSIANAAPSAPVGPDGCSAVAFHLDDIQGIYDGENIQLKVFPCGNVAVQTGANGSLVWGGVYYGMERTQDGNIVISYMDGMPGLTPLTWSGVQYRTLVIMPDVPGRIRLWSITPAGVVMDNAFDTYLDKTSDDPRQPNPAS